MSRRSVAAAVAVALAGLFLALWVVWLEPRSLIVREVAVTPTGWPASARPLRVAVLTDLHVGSPFNGLGKLRRVVAATNAARPDIVCLLGDFVITNVAGGRFVPAEDIARELRGLRAPLGVVGVLGNHDWWYDAARVRTALESAGVRFVEDTARRFERPGGGGFWVAGVSDLWEGRHDVRAALAAVRDTLPVILLSHNPDVFPTVPTRVALTLAGHTHGGQVRLPLLGRRIVPSRFGERYAAGHVVEGGRQLFVSTGVGTSILPVRFRVTPEVTMLSFGAAGAAGSVVRSEVAEGDRRQP